MHSRSVSKPTFDRGLDLKNLFENAPFLKIFKVYRGEEVHSVGGDNTRDRSQRTYFTGVHMQSKEFKIPDKSKCVTWTIRLGLVERRLGTEKDVCVYSFGGRYET